MVVCAETVSSGEGDLGFFKAFRLSKDPPSFMTLFEDSVRSTRHPHRGGSDLRGDRPGPSGA